MRNCGGQLNAREQLANPIDQAERRGASRLDDCDQNTSAAVVTNDVQVIKANEKLTWMLSFDIPIVEYSVGKEP
jgi:hypothetical protein